MSNRRVDSTVKLMYTKENSYKKVEVALLMSRLMDAGKSK
mgnify:CR=1 FL=1